MVLIPSVLSCSGHLTKLGRKMAEFPLEPEMSKTLLTSCALGCGEEVATIVAMLNVQGEIFYRPKVPTHLVVPQVFFNNVPSLVE